MKEKKLVVNKRKELKVKDLQEILKGLRNNAEIEIITNTGYGSPALVVEKIVVTSYSDIDLVQIKVF